jgi:hypothetical protein
MGYIKEPEGVDFVIKSKPLTDKERAAISEFIRQYKEKEKAKRLRRRARLTKSKKQTQI